MSEWKTVRLGDVCEILDSKRVPITAHERKNGSYPYYGANGIQDYVADYIFDDELVLLAEDGGNFGSKEKPIAYRVSGKCWVNNHAHVLKPKECLDVDYLCDSIKFYDVSTIVNGATRQKLTQSAMVEMKIFLPPLETQKQIAAQLDKCTSIITKHKQMLEKYDTLIKSRFIEMFGNIELTPQKRDWKELKEITKIFTGTTPSTTDEENWNGTILWITPAEMTSDSFMIYDTKRKITEKGRSSKSLDIMPIGTVLLSTRAPIGKTGIVGNPMTCNQGFKNFLCNSKKLNPIYLYILLRNNTVFLNSKGSGTTFKELSKSVIEKIKIPIPPLTLQTQFADFVQQIDKSKFEMEKIVKLCYTTLM